MDASLSNIIIEMINGLQSNDEYAVSTASNWLLLTFTRAQVDTELCMQQVRVLYDIIYCHESPPSMEQLQIIVEDVVREAVW